MSNTNRLDQLLGFLEDSPSDSFLKFAIAKEYEKLSRLDKALVYYQSILENDKAYVGLYYHLGKLYEEINEPNLALQTYELGIIQCKEQVDFHALSEINNAKTNLEITMSN